MQEKSRIYYFALFTTLLAGVVVILGAYTRLVDAGLGCPDWPGCYGSILVPNTPEEIAQANQLFPESKVEVAKGWAEMIHRYFAGFLGLCIFLLCFLVIRKNIKIPKQPVILAISLCILVVWQALFGMWTVTLKLWPQIVTAHLLGGFATLSLLWLITLKLSNRPAITNINLSNKLKLLTVFGLIILIGQIFLGGWTSSNYAALSCPDFPYCHGQWWPSMNFQKGFNLFQSIGPNYLGGLLDNQSRTAIHYTHRIGAVITTLVLLLISYRLLMSGSLKRLGLVLLFALTLQIALGISNIVWLLPLSVAVAHNAGGALLLLTLVTIVYYLFSSQSNNCIVHE